MKMKPLIQFPLFITLIAGMVSCNKDLSNINSSGNPAITSTINALQAVGVGTVNALSRNQSDSIYVINTCGSHDHRDSIAFSALPSGVNSYLATNYAGYTGLKAFSVKDSAGAVKGYVVVIQYNGKPVGLKFDASGNFVSVLEQREGRDLEGPGWHQGGRFDDRGGRHDDTLSIGQLPAAVQSYFSTNYPADTIVKAHKERDSSMVVISVNNGVFATVFSSNGTFVKRITLNPVPDPTESIDQSALPAVVLSYLTATYPGYVFKEAFQVKKNGTVQGYLVSITANNTHYAVVFDGSGNFIKAFVVR